MKASLVTALLAQALAASASQMYCNGGQGLASGNTCDICASREKEQTPTAWKRKILEYPFPTFRGSCFSPQSIRDQEDTSQQCSGGFVYCVSDRSLTTMNERLFTFYSVT
ncbi:hypothetical protein BDP81DRAFT_474655 [Colletotrichum phormii]|uniref:Uncharacterized protein n=1 Tax=Colletotrichum phormii TaxID=359342 RepID=A0AAJ0ECP3_9PEZI|nr:uncharacterized protein BDP81DRAFT_474655 [Colletotrichum phormii]KAK1624903.1 hypothetical protein BDP81DRAFT_474655 [Colletotrichum phormii]